MYKFIPHNDYDMGIESSRESASANVEKKPDIIALLKQHLPSASVESFSALKPEVQRAVEKRLQNLVQVGDKNAIQEWDNNLSLNGEVAFMDFLDNQKKTKVEHNGNQTTTEVKSVGDKNNEKESSIAIKTYDELKNKNIEAYNKGFWDLNETQLIELFKDPNKIGEIQRRMYLAMKEWKEQLTKYGPQADYGEYEHFIVKLKDANLLSQQQYNELARDIVQVKKDVVKSVAPEIEKPVGQDFTKIGNEYYRFDTDGTTVKIEQNGNGHKKEIIGDKWFSLSLPLDKNSELQTQNIQEIANKEQELYQLSLLDKTEKTLLKIEKTLKENNLPEEQKAELVQAKTELEAQSKKLREQLQIEASVPRDEIAAIISRKLVITRMEIVQLKKGTDLTTAQKEERRELEAKRSVVAIEELGLSFLNSQNTHRLVDALADSANVDIASGVDRSKKEQLAQEFAGLLGVKVENLYPNYGKDLHFSSPDPRRENGQDISRNEFFLNKLSSALKMSPSDLLGADLNYNALTDTIKGKTTQSKTDSSLASIY